MSNPFTTIDFLTILPEIIVAGMGMVVVLIELFGTGRDTRNLAYLSLLTLIVAGYAETLLLGRNLEGFWGTVTADDFSVAFELIFLLVAGLTILISMRFLENQNMRHGEYYSLLLFATSGMMFLASGMDLLMIFIGLEIFSLSLYVLTGLTRMRVRSVEAALKYFLLGAFSSGFMAYGMALIYGATGTLDLARLASSQPGRLLWVGMGLVLIGLAFKIAVVPFHQWVPDVYQGAPTNVTGFMAAATKTAAFAVLLRFLLGAFEGFSEIWIPLVFWLAVLTMTVANLVALAQTNMKRLLAFSSIAHAGYVLIAVVSNSAAGVEAILFYLAAYALMTVGAFAVLVAIGRGDAENERGYTLSEWAGLGWSRPMLALAMTLFMFSMAGIPPTGGFFGKYVVFKSAIESQEYTLAIIGVLNAAVATYYYLKVIMTMYMREPEGDELPLPVPLAVGAVMLVSVVGTIYLGIAPGQLLGMSKGLASTLI